LILYIPIS